VGSVDAKGGDGNGGQEPTTSKKPEGTTNQPAIDTDATAPQNDKNTFKNRVTAVVKQASGLDKLCKSGGLAEARQARESWKMQKLAAMSSPTTCPKYCGTSANDIDFCAYTDNRLAAAAIAVDWDQLSNISRDVDESLATDLGGAFTSEEREKVPEKAGQGGALHDALAGAWEIANEGQSAIGVPDVFSVEFATKALSGLAKLIEDRARFEAVGWFMEELGKYLCGPTASKDPLLREVSTYWLPSVCDLSRKDQLWEYGAGGALWRSLQASVKSDFEGFPGALAGIALSEIYFDEVGPSIPDAKRLGVLACGSDTNNGSTVCKAVAQLRSDSQKRVHALLRGNNAALVFSQWSADMHRASKSASSARLDMLSCATGLPYFIDEHDGAFIAALGAQRAPSALGIAAALAVDGCATLIVGEQSSTRPRLKWIASNGALLHQADALADSAQRLKLAIEAYRATKDLAKGNSDPPKLPSVSLSGDANPKAVSAAASTYVESAAKSTSDVVASQRVIAAFAVADAVIDVSDDAADLLAAIGTAGKAKVKAQDVAEYAQKSLTFIRAAVGVARAAALGDWAGVGSGAVTLLGKADELREASHCVAGLARFGVSTYASKIATLAAILDAKDADEMAKALDAVADPPGGWRLKGKDGSFVFSLTAHAGFFAAGELRTGTYGAFHENGEKLYGQAPTLALPVGLDFTWGVDSPISPVGLFVPILDPAGFLNYDADQGGKVPGPSVLTALSPGLGFRWSIRDTPFGFVLPYFVFRPSLRQWDPDPDGGGAHAFQLGGMISVDVTLYKIIALSREGRGR